MIWTHKGLFDTYQLFLVVKKLLEMADEKDIDFIPILNSSIQRSKILWNQSLPICLQFYILSKHITVSFRMDIEPMSISSPQKTPGNIGTPKSSSSYMPAYLIGNMNTPGLFDWYFTQIHEYIQLIKRSRFNQLSDKFHNRTVFSNRAWQQSKIRIKKSRAVHPWCRWIHYSNHPNHQETETENSLLDQHQWFILWTIA